MPIDPTAVAVASRSFSRNPGLRQELLDRYPGSKFNDAGPVVLSGDALIQFLRPLYGDHGRIARPIGEIGSRASAMELKMTDDALSIGRVAENHETVAPRNRREPPTARNPRPTRSWCKNLSR